MFTSWGHRTEKQRQALPTKLNNDTNYDKWNCIWAVFR